MHPLRSLFAFLLVFILSGASGCKRGKAGEESLASKALVQHLRDAKRIVSFAPLADEVIWTDSALLERAKTLPPALDAHVRASTGTTSGEAMTGLLQRLEAGQGSAKEARLERSGTRCTVVAAPVEVLVDCVYLSYLEERYPDARYLVTGSLDPVLIAQGHAAQGALMPIKP